MTMDARDGAESIPIGEAYRNDALELLQEALEWVVSARRWTQIDELLIALRDSWFAGDGGRFRDVVGDLEVLSPLRANDAGRDSGTPPPEPVRDRINDTIHEIGRSR
jgi:hypothetical protein